MAIKPWARDLLWMTAGAVIFLAFTSAMMLANRKYDPAEQLASKARRIAIVDRMRVALASASENEKSAVLAVTDEESQMFADQARAATAAVEQARQELGGLQEKIGTEEERSLSRHFSEAFTEFRRVDDELLSLAVKNTNLKAYALAYGPAANALSEMNDALSRLVAAREDAPDAAKVMRLAFGAETAALRLQAMIPPHIAEESDERMDRMEERMAKEEQEVQTDLDGLLGLPAVRDGGELPTARASWAKFGDLKTQIIALSRENTNVRSLEISLSRKRKVAIACQEILSALRSAIDAEVVAGITREPSVKPR